MHAFHGRLSSSVVHGVMYCLCAYKTHMRSHSVHDGLTCGQRAALYDHAKDCDLKQNTACEACYLWRDVVAHAAPGQPCFESGAGASSGNHVKVKCGWHAKMLCSSACSVSPKMQATRHQTFELPCRGNEHEHAHLNAHVRQA